MDTRCCNNSVTNRVPVQPVQDMFYYQCVRLASVHGVCVRVCGGTELKGGRDFFSASQADMETYILWIVVAMETVDNLATYAGSYE